VNDPALPLTGSPFAVDPNGFVEVDTGSLTSICIKSDVNLDGVFEVVLFTIVPPEPADGEDVSVQEASILDVIVTMDTTQQLPIAGVDVNLYAGLGGGTCIGVPLQTLQTDALGEVHFLVTPDGDYCVDSDPNLDLVLTSADVSLANDPFETGALNVDATINEPNVLDVLTTVGGVATAGVTVEVSPANAGDSATDCVDAPIASGVTDALGEAHILIGDADPGNFCIIADPNGDLTGTTVLNFDLVAPEVWETGTPDVTIDEGIVFELELRVGGVAITTPPAVSATIHTANVGDTATDCLNGAIGAPVPADATGVAQFVVATAGSYCFEADPNGDTTLSALVAAAVPSASGPTDDGIIDGFINENPILDVNVVSTALGPGPIVGATVEAHPANPGDTAAVCGDATITNSAVTDANGDADILVPPGSYCVRISTGTVTGVPLPVVSSDGAEPTGTNDATITEP
jgi:hypothetical protein